LRGHRPHGQSSRTGLGAEEGQRDTLAASGRRWGTVRAQSGVSEIVARCDTKVLAAERGHALVSSRRMPSPSKTEDERVRSLRLQMPRRLRPFTLYWLATSAVWVALLVVQSHFGLVRAALILAGELAILATAFRLVGRAPDGRRVPVVLVVTSVVLGAS